MFRLLLERLALALEQFHLPYMVIGGQAVLLYGEPRLTRDIDLTLGADTDRLQDVLDLAASLPLQVLTQDPQGFAEQTKVLPTQWQEAGIRVDFIFSNTPYERQALQRVRLVPLGKSQVCFASPEDVIIHKVLAGRPRDTEDVRGILLKTKNLDTAYIRHWLREFDQALNAEFLNSFESLMRDTAGK